MKLTIIKPDSSPPNNFCKDVHQQTLDYYKVIGFNEPWVSYYVEDKEKIIGCCAFKGKPNKDNKVEIAYYTFEQYEGNGYGTKMCALLIDIAKSAGDIKIFARTLPQKNASTSILAKNEFRCLGVVNDPEDGEVWEWEL